MLAARGTELERSFGFGIVHQLLDPVVRALGGDERERLISGAARLAEPLLAGQGDDTPLTEDPSYGVLHGLYWLLANLADRRPVLVAIDDASGSIGRRGASFEFLAPRLEGVAVGVAVAAREQRGTMELESAPSLARQASERIELRPLSREAVRSLVGDRLRGEASDGLCHACRGTTGGNPSSCTSCCASSRAGRRSATGSTPRASDGSGRAPSRRPCSVGSDRSRARWRSPGRSPSWGTEPRSLLIAGDLVAGADVLETALDGLPESSPELAGRIEGQLLLFGTTAVRGRQRLRERLVTAPDRLDRLPPEQARFRLPALAFDRAVGDAADAEAATALARRALADPVLWKDRSDASIVYGATEALWVTGRCEESERGRRNLGSAQARGSRWPPRCDPGGDTCEATSAAPKPTRGRASSSRPKPLGPSSIRSPPRSCLACCSSAGSSTRRGRCSRRFEVFGNDDDFGFVQLLHVKEAELALARGDGEGALARLALCRRFELGWGENPLGIACAVDWRSPAALANLAVDRRSEARALAEDQVQLARSFGVARWLAPALRVLGGVERDRRALDALE